MDISADISCLVGNKFWDNFDKKHEDLRNKFIKGLKQYYETYPNRLKKNGKQGSIKYMGLFGTGGGISINVDAFPLKQGYYISTLIKDYCDDNNIPYVISCSGQIYYVFSNNYSKVLYEYQYRHRYTKEDVTKAQIEVYGETSMRNYYITIHVTYDSEIPAEDNHKIASIIENDITIDKLNELFKDNCLIEFKQKWADLYYKKSKYVNGMITLQIISNRPLEEFEEKELYEYIMRQLNQWKDDLELNHSVYNVYD